MTIPPDLKDRVAALESRADDTREREKLVRQDERERIAKHIRTVANDMLRDAEADAIDGYTAAVMLNLSDVILKNGEGSPPEFWKARAHG